jgi:hypothetical protein
MSVKYVINEIMDMTIIPNKYVAHWDETKYVTMSSFVFMVPSIYGYYNELYKHAIILFLASTISANYWRDATYSYRRIMDRIISKIAFILFFKDGIIYVRYLPFFMICWNLFVLFTACYYFSNRYCGNSPDWWKYHVTFHLMSSTTQMMVINSIIHSENNDCKQYKIE